MALPLTLTGGKASDDPEIQALHDELHDLNQRLRSHVVRFQHMCRAMPRSLSVAVGTIAVGTKRLARRPRVVAMKACRSLLNTWPKANLLCFGRKWHHLIRLCTSREPEL